MLIIPRMEWRWIESTTNRSLLAQARSWCERPASGCCMQCWRWIESTANCSLLAQARFWCERPASGWCMRCWRRARDSNPRNPFEFNGFQDRRFQPLTQLSASWSAPLSVYLRTRSQSWPQAAVGPARVPDPRLWLLACCLCRRGQRLRNVVQQRGRAFRALKGRELLTVVVVDFDSRDIGLCLHDKWNRL